MTLLGKRCIIDLNSLGLAALSMNRVLFGAFLVIFLCHLPVACLAATFYIAPTPQGSDTHPGTQAQPFATIQRGLEWNVCFGVVLRSAGGQCLPQMDSVQMKL